MTVDQAMCFRWAGVAAEEACLVLQAEAKRLQAKLARVEALPARWRAAEDADVNRVRRYTTMDGVSCTKELEAALNGTTP